eukprot:COSAG05_NODE_390_length_10436_cov_15.721196_9_plen_83_part_00
MEQERAGSPRCVCLYTRRRWRGACVCVCVLWPLLMMMMMMMMMMTMMMMRVATSAHRVPLAGGSWCPCKHSLVYSRGCPSMC